MHDFNPGIASNGLFWTAPIPGGSSSVNLGTGAASLHVADLDVEDYGNVVNALKDGPSVEASVSFDATWSGVQRRVNVRSEAANFAAVLIHNAATLTWSATESGFGFQADPHESGFAAVGFEHNGIFF